MTEVTRLANGEFGCTWTCPGCGHAQSDSVHKELGPFVSCTCGNCGKAFSDESLDSDSRTSWEAARLAAEDSQPAT